MKITLRNDFHGTEYTIHCIHGRLSSGWIISASQAKRADRRLCGMSDCCCGGIHRDARYRALYQSGQGVVDTDGGGE